MRFFSVKNPSSSFFCFFLIIFSCVLVTACSKQSLKITSSSDVSTGYDVQNGEIPPMEDEEDIELDSEIELASIDPESIVDNSEAKVFAVNTHDQSDSDQGEIDSENESYIEYKKETPPKQPTQKEKKIIDNNAKNALCQPGETVCVNSQFGVRRSSTHWHRGIDIRAPYGSPVKAFRGGKILRAEYRGGYGKVIDILQRDGIIARYGHLSQFLVREGSIVKQGSVIGRVGSTGRSTGPHLHFELIRNKQQVNPLIMLSTASKVVTQGSTADALAARSASGNTKSVVISKKAKVNTAKSKGTGKVINNSQTSTAKKTSGSSSKKNVSVKSNNTKNSASKTAKDNKTKVITYGNNAKSKNTAQQQKKGTVKQKNQKKQENKSKTSSSKITKTKNTSNSTHKTK